MRFYSPSMVNASAAPYLVFASCLVPRAGSMSHGSGPATNQQRGYGTVLYLYRRYILFTIPRTVQKSTRRLPLFVDSDPRLSFRPRSLGRLPFSSFSLSPIFCVDSTVSVCTAGAPVEERRRRINHSLDEGNRRNRRNIFFGRGF